MRTEVFVIMASVLVVAACGDNVDTSAADAAVDSAPEVDAPTNLMPMTLAETGLCNDGPCAIINSGIHAYQPQYELFADGASKHRWIQLPPGTKIDTTDMNYWKFPVGTKVWKEFSTGLPDDQRVETRFMWKVGADDSLQASWYFAAFIWDAANTSSTFFDPAAGNPNANGTTHDVPSRSDCRRCHQNTPGRILGVNAMSLDFPATGGNLDLHRMVAMDMLSTPPTGGTNGRFFPLPGDPHEQAVAGFFHGNCGGCHNPTSSIHDTVPLELRIDVTKLAAVEEMPFYATTVDKQAQLSMVAGPLIKANDVAASVIAIRMGSLAPGIKMPEIGTKTLDAAGLAAVTAWINTSFD